MQTKINLTLQIIYKTKYYFINEFLQDNLINMIKNFVDTSNLVEKY